MSTQAASAEVSKKLKAAIRAKLEELGVYVDDELPDYIMVMIANKKEKSQMKEDLGLFIGKSTAKFVDWLFDLFDRLQSASAKNERSNSISKTEEDDSRKEDKRHKEVERRKHEDREREEREQEREREAERQREKDRERERERIREKDREERGRRREEERSKKRRSRSRSNTYSEDEDHKKVRKVDKERRHRESREKKKVASTVVYQKVSHSPEPQKVSSMVTVKRNIRPSGDASNAKARSNMFLRAMNDASVSAGYASHTKTSKDEPHEDDDDMSDLDALPTKSSRSRSKTVKSRLTYIKKSRKRSNSGESVDRSKEMDEDAVVVGKETKSGPQVIVNLSGGKEAIKKLKVKDRIVVIDKSETSRKKLKRKMEKEDETDDSPKSKHERIIFDLPEREDDDSPTLKKWNGQIQLEESDITSDEEAEIDAMLAETQKYSQQMEDDEELPPTHQLSGGNFRFHVNPQYQGAVPTYVPTPLNVLKEQSNAEAAAQMEDSHQRERCIFWPKCTKGDSCQFHHPVKNCTNFPNCTFGNRCLFIHPACKFDKFCTKKHCPFVHHGTGGVQPGAVATLSLSSNKPTPIPTAAPKITTEQVAVKKPIVPGALSSIAAKLAASLEAKKKQRPSAPKRDENNVSVADTVKNSLPKESEEVDKTETTAKEEIGPLQNLIPCRYAAACRNPGCYFKHPKECRFGTNCRNASCYFYHKPAAAQPSTEVTAKYKWSAMA